MFGDLSAAAGVGLGVSETCMSAVEAGEKNTGCVHFV